MTAHVFGTIASLERNKKGSFEVTLKGGTKFGLPPSAEGSYKKLTVGSGLLIDLSKWDEGRGMAHMTSFQNGAPHTHFAIGGKCELEIAPLYLMSVGGEKSFMPLQEAGVAWDSGYVRVECLNLVLESDMTVRPITDKEKNEMQEIADNHSSSK